MRQVGVNQTSGYNPGKQLTEPTWERPSAGEVVGAAFTLENDVYNAWQWLTKDAPAVDPTFNILEAGPTSRYWPTHAETLGEALSLDHMRVIEQQIAKEEEARNVLASTGTVGSFAAGMLAGVMSPLSLVPLAGPSRGAKGVAEAVALAAGAATTQEAVLYSTQKTRTAQEAMMGIGAGTLLGGLLGSAAVMLRGTAKTAAEVRLQEDAGGTPSTITHVGVDESGNIVERLYPLYDLNEAFDIAVPKTELPKPGLRDSGIAYSAPKKFPVNTSDALASNALHAEARQVAPEVFEQFDALLTRQASYRKWIDELQETGQLQVDRTLKNMDRKLAELEELRQTVTGKGPKARLRRQIADVKADKAELTAVRMSANQADIAEVRKALVKVDEQMRDMAKAIGKAYAKAREKTGASETVVKETNTSYMKGDVQDADQLFSGEATTELFPRPQELKPVGTAIEIKPKATKIEAGGGTGGSLSAASKRVSVEGLRAKNRFVKTVVQTLGKLNPVHRQITQKWFPAGRYWMAQLSDGGAQLNVVDDVTGESLPHIPAAAGGNIESRIQVHQKATALFLRELDDSYTAHVFGSSEGVFKGIAAKVRSGIQQLPEGKMSWKEFNQEIFRAANTGIEHPDPHVMRAKEALTSFFNYFKQVHDEALDNLKLEYGDDVIALIPEDANLGQGVMEYVHHIWDGAKVVDNSGELLAVLQDSNLQQLNSRFEKSYARHVKRRGDLEWRRDIQAASPEEVEARLTAREEEFETLSNDPELSAQEQYVVKMREEMRRAGATTKDIQAAVKKERESFGPEYTAKRARLRQLKEEIAFIKSPERLAQKALTDAELAKVEGIEKELAELSRAETGFPDSAIIDRRGALWKELDEIQGRLFKLGDLDARILRMDEAFDARWRERGATGNPIDGNVDFTLRAEENAQLTVHKLKGNSHRVAGMDILGGERGPELARGINIPFEQKVKFLETDLEKIARIYSRHMASDLELWRGTGSVNGRQIFDELRTEYENQIAKINAKEGDNTAELRALEKSYNTSLDDFIGVIERLRHQRGLPDAPDGFMHRAGRMAKAANVFRFMGSVVPSSIPDIARPIMVYGLTNTYRHGWGNLIKGTKAVKATREELRRFGLLWDTYMHNRVQQVLDFPEEYAGAKSPPERAVELLANKTGLVALFDKWTMEMKYIAGSTAIGTVSDALEVVMRTGPVDAKRLAKSKEILADLGWTPEQQRRIWEAYLTEGGSDLFDGGFRLPNTGNWTDPELAQTYAAGIHKVVNDMIVTPGVDKPLWMDKHLGYQLLAQFRSFTYASTNRTVIRGLQQADAGVLTGIVGSLGLGALSYYLWAMSAGGKAQADIMNASPEQWAYQAVSRSGLLGVLGEVQRVGETMPVLGGTGTQTRQPVSTVGAIGGPTVDLSIRLAKVMQELNNPTQSTQHTVRTLMAYQNVFYLRRLFDAVEEANPLNLPGRR